QKELLENRHQLDGTKIFVASYSIAHDEQRSRDYSHCVWSKRADRLLPETEEIFLVQISRPEFPHVARAVRGSWQKVRSVVGPLMEPQGTYPERWRVREFPTDAMLDQIGKPVETLVQGWADPKYERAA